MATPADSSPSMARCTALVERVLAASPRVATLLKKVEGAGCPFSGPPIVCEDVFRGAPVTGSYDAGLHRVILNPAVPPAAMTAAEWARTSAHELVHAFDVCRARVKTNDCLHLACTEIRAANLSGDCDFLVELQRAPGALLGGGLGGAQQRCVRRRAETSVAMHAACAAAEGGAARAVRDAWSPCYADIAPFASN
jgi:inner membrane protease ATP23